MEGLGTVASALLTLGLVAVAVALSLYGKLDLQRDIGIAVARSFVQLAAIGTSSISSSGSTRWATSCCCWP